MSTASCRTVINHAADDAWAVARDFNGLATWWSAVVAHSEIEEGKRGDQVGAIRRFTFGQSIIREQLLALSDLERSFSYTFCEPAPFPVIDYVATFRLTPVGRASCLAEYDVTFDCQEAERDYWTHFFPNEVFGPAIASLDEYLRQA